MKIDLINIFLVLMAILNLSFGYLIYSKNKKNKVNIFFSLFVLAVVFWHFGMIMYRGAKDPFISLIWCRWLYLFATLIPTALIFFAYVFPTGKLYISRFKKILILGVNFILILVSLWPNLLIKNVIFRSGAENIIIFGPGYIFYNFYIPFYFIWSFWILIKKYRKSSGILRVQLRYMIIGILISAIFGSTFNLFLPTFNYFALNWLGQIFSIVMIIFITYAIIRYRLMDIKVVIKKSLLYTLLVIYVAGAFTFISLLAGLYLHQISDFNETLVTIIISLLIVLSLDPLKKYLGRLTDKMFFKAQVNYQDVLKKLSEVISYELDLRILLDKFIKNVTTELKIKTAHVLLADKDKTFFKVESYLDGRKSIDFDQKNFLVKFLKKEKEIIIFEELERKITELEQNDERKNLEKIGDEFKKVNALLCVPIFGRNELTAILFLGEKFSGDMYTQQDLDMFEILIPEIAAAIEKSKLYEETKKFGEKLKLEVEKATTDLMSANERLKQLDQAKTEFISITSHQLRTPLSGLKGFLSMLLEGDFGELDETKREVIRDLLRSAERLVRIVNLFLDISRIELGKLRVEKKKTSIENLITEVVQEFIPEIDKKGLTIQFKKPEKSLGMIKMDRDKIKDAILNLIDNSIKYTEKGEITIKAGIKNKILEVAVEDTGMGIAKEDLPQLFAKFSRGSNRPPINPGGSGLGLFVVKKIIDLHEGEVWAESEGLGKGSKFIFKIPI